MSASKAPKGKLSGRLRRIFHKSSDTTPQPPLSDVLSATPSASSSQSAFSKPLDHVSLPSTAGDAQLTKENPSASKLTLWDRAYEALSNENPELVKEYQEMLIAEASGIGMALKPTP